ncbi:MAG: hypothetical protein ACTSPB_06760 [Candidatus Thorarchaeota archaeon]
MTSALASMNLTISTKVPLFVVERLLPGDIASRNLTLKNAGDVEIQYINVGAEIEGNLSEVLILNLSYDSKKYSMYLKNLSIHPINLGSLDPGQSKILFMDILLPSDVGNDYQGTEAKVNFTFTAVFEGSPSHPSGGGGFFHICGDGKCSWSEDAESCPRDCASTTTTTLPEESVQASEEVSGNATMEGQGIETTTTVPRPGIAGYFLFRRENYIPLGLFILGLILLWVAYRKKKKRN